MHIHFAYIAQEVEGNHGKVEVTGSNPVVGSTHVASPYAKSDNFHQEDFQNGKGKI